MSDRRPHILIEDVDFMLATGEHPWRIAQRLDMTLAAMSRALQRAGRHDLACRFERIGVTA